MRSFLAVILSLLLGVMGFLTPAFSSNMNDSLLYVVGLSPDEIYASNQPDEPATEQPQTQEPFTEEPSTEHPIIADEDGYLNQTVMIYMVGSDLESQGGMATIDIGEIEDAGIDTSKHNIVLYTGGAAKWQNSVISAEKNSIYELSGSGFKEVKTMDRTNMGKPDTLSDFLTWTYENYSSDVYALVLWDHGGGPNVGYGCDENYFYDTLTLSEMSQALADSPFNENNKLEWVSFDACLMASIEIAEVFAPYSRYMMASQESEPGYGHYYEYLSCLNDGDATGDKVGEELASTYMEYYEELLAYDRRYECDMTISCMDLSQIENVKSAMDTVFTDAETGIMKGDFGEIVRKRTQTKAFGVFTTSNSYDLVDLYSLAEELSTLYGSCSELMAALNSFVIVNKTNVRGAHGVSVYYPYDNYEYQDYWMSSYDDISPSTVYTRFLRTMTGEEPEIDIHEVENNETDVAYDNVDWTLHFDNVSDRDGDGFAIVLTDEQKAYFSSANCGILIRDDDEKYGEIYGMLAVASNIMYDDSSEIYVPIEKYVVEMNNEAGDASYGGPILVYAPETDRDMLQVPGLGFYMEGDYTEHHNDAVILNLKLNEDGKHYDVVQSIMDDRGDDASEEESSEDASAEGVDDSSMIAEKQYVDISEYTIFSNYYVMREKTYDENGNLKIVTEWDKPGLAEGREVKVSEEGIKFTVIDIPEEDRGYYYAQFVVFDIYGNMHVSDLVPLQ